MDRGFDLELFGEDGRAALAARLKESMAQIERGEGIPGDRILDVLAK